MATNEEAEAEFVKEYTQILEAGKVGTHEAALVIKRFIPDLGFDRVCEIGNDLTADWFGRGQSKN